MYYVGIDIGGMSIKFGIVDDKGRMVNKNVLRVDYHTVPVEQVVEQMKGKVLELCNISKIKISEIKGIGIGCPGVCNEQAGILENANNLGWKKVPLVEMFKDLGTNTYIANDANCALIGEAKFGAGRDYRNLIMLTLGTGVGGGIMVDGKIYAGQESKGAELGHMCIELNGRQCGCGHKGCFEAYASVSALIKDTISAMELDKSSKLWDYCEHNIANVNGKTAFDVAYDGDVTAQKVVDQYIYYLGEGIRNYLNIFRPEAVILGGGLSGHKDKLTVPLIKYLDSVQWGQKDTPKAKIFVSELGNDAGIVGAAALAMK